MKILRRILFEILLIILLNIVAIIEMLHLKLWSSVMLFILFSYFYIFIHIKPNIKETTETKLYILRGGCDLLIYSMISLFLEIPSIAFIISFNIHPIKLIINFIFAAILIFLLMFNGVIRICVTSKQVKLASHILLFFFWWVPIINLIIMIRMYKIAKREYNFEHAKLDLDEVRAENEICRTKYPILLVHGIFFRDWQNFNYWGRIPKELTRNGAVIYYGNQQSAESIEVSANELKNQIEKIVQNTGYEKVNIIAHSKGGLDSRYAISCLGADKHIASLTTINTPHRGCIHVDQIINKAPNKLISYVTKKYNAVFKKLGDKKPDFYSGVTDLTFEKAKEINQIAPDNENIFYQSFMSEMNSMLSAPFPLNIGYILTQKYNDVKKNDGLVAVDSAKWGESFTVISITNRRGVSHGDMIDLMRENIKGFDVREFYVNLVADLKNKGF